MTAFDAESGVLLSRTCAAALRSQDDSDTLVG